MKVEFLMKTNLHELLQNVCC